MNDEPIINTQNCVFHKEDDYCSNPQVFQCRCAHVASCYFKEYERKVYECIKLKKQLESTKGLVTVGNRQLAEALLELQKYKDREQWEIELNKKRADSFKEMRRMLYGKVEGSSLIEKRSPYEN